MYKRQTSANLEQATAYVFDSSRIKTKRFSRKKQKKLRCIHDLYPDIYTIYIYIYFQIYASKKRVSRINLFFFFSMRSFLFRLSPLWKSNWSSLLKPLGTLLLWCFRGVRGPVFSPHDAERHTRRRIAGKIPCGSVSKIQSPAKLYSSYTPENISTTKSQIYFYQIGKNLNIAYV